MKMLKGLLKDEKGFTLIELIIVIVILAVIAAIAIPNIIGAVDNSRRSTDITNAKSIANAVAQVKAKNDAFAAVTYTTAAALNVSTLNGASAAADPLDDFENALYRELGNNPPDPRYQGSTTVTETSFYLVVDINGNIQVYAGNNANVGVAANANIVYPTPAVAEYTLE